MMITEIKLHVHLLAESNVNIRVEVACCDDLWAGSLGPAQK